MMRSLDVSWSWAVRNILLPAGDRFFAQGMMRRLSFLEKAQWWSRQEIYEYRDRRLQKLLKVAYQEVPFYRSLFDDHGVDWRAIDKAEKLPQIPLVTKDMMRPHYPQALVRNTGLKTYEASSSGSTGKIFSVREDGETAGQYRAAFLLALEWAGWHIGEAHMQTGMTLARSRDRALKDALLRCHYISAFELADEHLDRALDLLENQRIEHLWGYPGSLYYLSRRALQRGWNRPLKTAVTWGDNLYAHYRDSIERAFGTRVFDTYGCGEGFQIAAQCGSGGNYHLHSLDIIVEFVDQDGRPVPNGEAGDIVVTRLHPGPMPLVRYRVGDVGASGFSNTCPCGRELDLLASVQGRDTDVVVTRSGNRLIVHFFTSLMSHFPEVDCFQVLQNEAGSMLLRLVPVKPGAIDPSLERRIVETLKTHGAAEIEIDLEQVEAIPTAPSGKRRFVISTVSREKPVRPTILPQS
jgi:phenylacetate-CoA ligase